MNLTILRKLTELKKKANEQISHHCNTVIKTTRPFEQ